MISPVINEAKKFCKVAHGDQKRKYTGEPYWTHPFSVALIVMTITHTEDMVVAALLHDTIEDTTTTFDDINKFFGYHVACMVRDLTDKSKPEDGNRETRKKIDREALGNIEDNAKTVKLADLIHNTGSIVQCDNNFAKVYMKEKALTLPFLKGGNSILWGIAYGLLTSYEEALVQNKLESMLGSNQQRRNNES